MYAIGVQEQSDFVRIGRYTFNTHVQETIIGGYGGYLENAHYFKFFLWKELEPRCQQRAAGSLELSAK